MNNKRLEPTAAQMIAGLARGTAQYEEMEMKVQRSHRFPVGLFLQIENLASVSRVPVSMIINLLIESGLEAVKKEISPDLVRQLTHSPIPLDERYAVKKKGQK